MRSRSLVPAILSVRSLSSRPITISEAEMRWRTARGRDHRGFSRRKACLHRSRDQTRTCRHRRRRPIHRNHRPCRRPACHSPRRPPSCRTRLRQQNVIARIAIQRVVVGSPNKVSLPPRRTACVTFVAAQGVLANAPVQPIDPRQAGDVIVAFVTAQVVIAGRAALTEQIGVDLAAPGSVWVGEHESGW